MDTPISIDVIEEYLLDLDNVGDGKKCSGECGVHDYDSDINLEITYNKNS